MSDHHLTVVREFGEYRRGDHIEDPAEIARILAGEQSVHVIKVFADKPSAPPVSAAAEEA